jgi:magnesium transporter
MITAFVCEGGRLHPVPPGSEAEALSRASWFDLEKPNDEEKALVERITGLHVASEEELNEIESSSRLAVENGALYLSMPLVTRVEGDTPTTSPLGFVVTPERLITIRFQPSRLFEGFADRLPRDKALNLGPCHVFVGLLEAIVDRIADVLEQIRSDLDTISLRIFKDDAVTGRRRREDAQLHVTLKRIGRIGDLVSRIRDSLLGVGRIVPYAGHVAAGWIPADLRPRFKTLRQDIASLNDYDAHLANKIQFLLDAVLGFINIAQNNIIKVLTVVSVVGVPPTLVASIYGMNFKRMPELDWTYGYPYVLTLIIISAILPLIWFMRRGWL